jgi:hypothetical protein
LATRDAGAECLALLPPRLGDIDIGWIGLGEVAHVPFLDLARDRRQAGHNVGDQARPCIQCHEPKEITCLGVVIIAFPVVIAVGIIGGLQVSEF